MKTKTRRILKILAAVLAFALIILILAAADSLVGNPISRAMAQHSIEKYVEETYPDLELTVDRARYNFKFGEYFAIASSPTSQDTFFAVHWRSGKVAWDDYESNVLQRSNTYFRLCRAYRDAVEPLIEEGLPWDFDMVLADLDSSGELDPQLLPLDMEADPYHLPLDTEISIYRYVGEVSWEAVAETALELDAFLRENGFEPDIYSVVLEPGARKEDRTLDTLGVYDFPRELLASEDLPRVMEEHFIQWEQSWEKK